MAKKVEAQQEPKEPEVPNGIEGMAGTELSAEELALLDEGKDEPAKRDQDEPPTPEPTDPPDEPETPPAPRLEAEPDGDEPPEKDEPAHSDHDRILNELRALPEADLRERVAKLYKDSVGQRGAIARITQTRRDRELELEAAREDLRREREQRLVAERLLVNGGQPPAPDAPPRPTLPKGLKVERDEDGNYFISADAARDLVQSFVPKPPEPRPEDVQAQRLRADFERIAGQDPSFRPTIQRLETARQFLITGLRQAQQQYGHHLRTVEDSQNVARAYGLDRQVEQHWPGVRFEDLIDFAQGGRLSERVVEQFARSWFPEGVREKNGAPRPVLFDGDPAGAPPSNDPPAGPAPRHTGHSQRLPLGEKPPTMNRRGGLRPEPGSAMNAFLDAKLDDLISKPRTEVEAILGSAIRELEGQR